ncbi:MAG: OsmC family protein [Anaerolineales bacterium]|nr:OsmC family protein [Anaerolineales bacterium]
MHATVNWSGRMSFAGTAESGFSLPLGADPAVGGDTDGFRPIELMLVGLAGCTAMDVISILHKKKLAVSAFEVRAEAERADEHPRVFTRIHLRYRVTGTGIDPAAVARAIELSETRYCPAQAMLRPAVPITSSFEILDAG